MSTESKPTPGPWSHSAYEGGWDCVRDANGAILCKLDFNNPANARLIAAAPDLLEAAKKAVSGESRNAGGRLVLECWLEALEKAITKAEGKP